MHISVQNTSVRIAYVGGGSLNWAISLMGDLASDSRLAAEVRLFDTDFEAACRNAEIGKRFASVSAGEPAKYSAHKEISEALDGAGLVVISILPGAFEDMAQDVGIPASFGVPQAVGDTVGPGGLFRALRAAPMMMDIARAIRLFAPDAFVCNLTNPMSVCTGALYAAYPEIKAWGECHEVTKIRRQVTWIANREAGKPVFDHRQVQVRVKGINHFTFVDQMALAGQDMMPAYRAFASEFERSGWLQVEAGKTPEHDRYFGTRNLVSFDLFRRFGIPAAAGDRHLAEFLPVKDYLNDPESWGFALTPVSYRIQDRKEKLSKVTKLLDGTTAPIVTRSDESLLDQIVALSTGVPFVSNVNLPNIGQIDGLPLGHIVETNAIFDGTGMSPVCAGSLPEGLNAIMCDHATRQSELISALNNEDAAQIFALFQSDPLVRDLPLEKMREMFDQMRSATAPWLPDYLRKAA
ncbi:alpha-galactosidase [Shimia sp.]|uniref:family 4 glycosyl hydrolase n=1 Tax=Shimia sp. TaxID=1954381 RepID=UPI003B8DEF6D